MSIPILLQSAYTLAATSILLANALPPLKLRFIAYGKTSTIAPSSSSSLLDKAATLTVPHLWFTHFYILGFGVSIFWAVWLVTGHGVGGGGDGMGIEQTLLAWACFAVQTARRLYECLYIQKSGPKSSMWIAHYLVGLLFYSATSVAVWIEGSAALAAFDFSPKTLWALINAPTLKSFMGIITFLLASGVQHDCHAYLASLQKYSLPQHPFFRGIVCPHYTAEVAIYLAIALLAAPQGQLLNRTVAAAAGFVATILTVAAGTNREWYRRKFGAEKVKGRWCILPGVY